MDIGAMRLGAETPAEAVYAELPQVAADLADAFAEDVMFDWFLRPDARRDEARLRFFRFVVANMAFGVGRIDRPATGPGAAIWLPFEALKPTPLLTELRAIPTLLFATGLGRMARLGAVREAMDKRHPMDRPHAYLMFLGVARRAQGRGVGSRLLQLGVERCDAAGMPAYLETQTERNIGLYRRYGFEIIWEERPRPDAPVLWGMWREPRDTAEA